MPKPSPFSITAGALIVALLLPAGGASAGPLKKELAFAVSVAQKGLWNEAIFRFEKLLRKSPDNPRLWNNLAVAYEASGRYHDAAGAYERAVLLSEDDVAEPLAANREAFSAFYAAWVLREGGGGTGTDAPGEAEEPQAGSEESRRDGLETEWTRGR